MSTSGLRRLSGAQLSLFDITGKTILKIKSIFPNKKNKNKTTLLLGWYGFPLKSYRRLSLGLSNNSSTLYFESNLFVVRHTWSPFLNLPLQLQRFGTRRRDNLQTPKWASPILGILTHPRLHPFQTSEILALDLGLLHWACLSIDMLFGRVSEALQW